MQATPVRRENLRPLLGSLLGPGDFLLNVSVDVSSPDLIALCQERGALYLDTCIEPWAGGYHDASVPPAQRTNYALREAALALRRPARDGPTAVLTHGANCRAWCRTSSSRRCWTSRRPSGGRSIRPRIAAAGQAWRAIWVCA